MFSRSEVRLLKALVKPMVLTDLAHAIHLSVSRTSELVASLTKKRLVEKGRRLYWSHYSYADLLRELLHENPSIDFEGFLYGKKLDILLEVCFNGGQAEGATGISLDGIAIGAHTTKAHALNTLYELRKLGLVYRQGGAWLYNKTLWPKLADFLVQYKKFAHQEFIMLPRGTINKKLVGTLTGFSVYSDYGILVYPKTDLYITHEEKLDAEKVFVHSLYQISDTRTRKLAREFLEKNKLDKDKVRQYARQLGLLRKLGEVMQ